MPEQARALVALGFLATGAAHLVPFLRSVRRPALAGRRTGRLDDLAHALMGAQMAAMLAPLPLRDRWGGQAALMAVITGWFTVRALTAQPRLAHHALTAATMTGMLLQPLMDGPATEQPTGMAMSGMPGATAGGPGIPFGTPVAVCLLASAAWWAVTAYRTASADPTVRLGWRVRAGLAAAALAHVAMAAGMAAILVPIG